MPRHWFRLTIALVALITMFVLQGVRNKASWIMRRPRSLRVNCVGDSITFGNGSHVGNPDAIRKNRGNYPLTLHRLLSQAFPGVYFTVGNYGLSGATTMDVALATEMGLRKRDLVSYLGSAEYNQAKATEPDLTVFMLGTNDAKSDPVSWTSARSQKWGKQARKLLTEFLPERTSVSPSSRLGTWVMLPPEIVDDFRTKWQKKNMIIYKETMEDKIRDLWRSIVALLGSKTRGEIFPAKSNPRTAFVNPGDVLHLEVIDTAPVVNSTCRKCYVDALHPSEEGANRIAQLVFNTIEPRVREILAQG